MTAASSSCRHGFALVTVDQKTRCGNLAMLPSGMKNPLTGRDVLRFVRGLMGVFG
jgi:hypothetical protein